MIASTASQRGYSATVRMELIANRRSYPVAKAGPTQLTLVEPADIPAGDARLVITVDGRPVTWTVHLPNGAVPFDHEVTITVVAAEGPFHVAVAESAMSS